MPFDVTNVNVNVNVNNVGTASGRELGDAIGQAVRGADHRETSSRNLDAFDQVANAYVGWYTAAANAYASAARSCYDFWVR